jgi:Sec-independent protein translocase protein TatA
MKAATIAAIALLWSLFMGVCGFSLGYYIRGAREVTKEVQAERKDANQKDRKDRKAFAAGVRTEQAQAKADTAFQRIRTDYEADQRKNPAAGCVLDPDSLRQWNAAAAQSDSEAAGQPDGEVPAAPDGEARRERGQ